MNTELFKNGIKALGTEPTEKQIQRFEEYSRLLVEWNEKMNLTAVTDPDGIAVKHFLDSVLPTFKVRIEPEAKVADIGTGAGFPGLPIKIMRPDIKLTLVDSLNKRINFLNETVTTLELNDTECIHSRAEELAKATDYREKFDVVVSRAVANMTVLSEYCLPFVKVDGMFVALKAENSDEELKSAENTIAELGGKIEEVISAPLPMSDMTRKIIVVRKISETPKKFPRRGDKIKKSAAKA